MGKENKYDHFQGKEAIQHIAEVQVEGIIASHEIHGAETPGCLFAACDAARDTAIVLLLIILLLERLQITPLHGVELLMPFCFGWLFWKFGRGAWLAWARLERLHRVMQEEKHEIDTNREQEREELKALYQAKGFQGKLLDEVVDVLMADGDRLLRVMLEEEMGFRLRENEHPLIQGLGAATGVLVAALSVLGGYLVYWQIGALIATLALFFVTAGIVARHEKNRVISAVCWNGGLALFAYTLTFYLLLYI